MSYYILPKHNYTFDINPTYQSDPLHVYISHSLHTYLCDSMQSINQLEQGALIDDKDNSGDSAIVVASECGYLNIVEYLLNCGAKIEDKCLYFAAVEKKGEMTHFWLSRGLNMHYKNLDGHTALQVLARNQDGWDFKNKKTHIMSTLYRWPVTMLIVVLQELAIFDELDYAGGVDYHG